MKVYPSNKIRNVVILGHGGCGKTTLTEAMAFLSGITTRMGKTDDGNTISDYDKEEIKRHFSIGTSVIPIEWEDYKINIFDTPGYFDFVGEVEEAVAAADAAIIVVSGKAGVEVGTEKAWEICEKYKLPRIVFVNKLDAIGADFDMSVASLKEKLGANAKAVQYPIGISDTLSGVIDLIKMEAWDYSNCKDRDMPTKIEIPAEYLEKCKLLREELLEDLAQFDDDFMMKILEGEDPTVEEIKKIIKKAVLEEKFYPVFCGSAYKNKGVQLLLDGIVDYLPSPLEIPCAKGTKRNGETYECKADDNEPLVGLAFKIATDPFIGRLAYVRVYSGVLKSGSYVLNSSKGIKERIARLVLMHANHRQEVEELHAGDIGAIIGLKNTTTGETLCAENTFVELEKMEFPEPVIEEAVEPKTKADQDKMGIALAKLAEEDPTFKVHTDPDSGQTIIAGVGELHLDIIIDRLRREFNVNVEVGKPQVGYRETIKQLAECEGKYVKQSGGRGQYGHVWIRFEPNPGKGFEFVNAVVGGTVPKEYIKPTEDGLVDSLTRGLIAGYPCVDIKATLFDGSSHDVDSSEAAYKVAASLALKEAAKKCKPVILEPIMKVEITVPEQYYGDVIGDVSRRRGNMVGESQRGNAKIVEAHVPLSEMFGYVTDLRSFTQGRGMFSMEFDHFGECPKNIQDEIIKKSGLVSE